MDLMEEQKVLKHETVSMLVPKKMSFLHKK